MARATPSGRPGGAQRDLLDLRPASRVVGATCFASRSTQDVLAGRRSASFDPLHLRSNGYPGCSVAGPAQVAIVIPLG